MKRFFVQLKDHTQVFVCVGPLTSRYNKGKYRGTKGKLKVGRRVGIRKTQRHLALSSGNHANFRDTIRPLRIKNSRACQDTPFKCVLRLAQIHHRITQGPEILCHSIFFSCVFLHVQLHFFFYKKYPLNFVSQNVRFHLWISQCRQQKK
jgi:hypothetical protein